MIDELDEQLAKAMQRPAFAAAYADSTERHRLLDSLVAARREVGLSQTEVARRMGITQPTVSQFECEDSDPRASTLMRYARALGLRVRFELEQATAGDA